MKKTFRENKAITLIALVITIVVLIILAGVAINLSLGDNGIFYRAKTAKEQYQNAQDYEQTEIGKVSNEIDSYIIDSRSAFKLSEEDFDLSNYASNELSIADSRLKNIRGGYRTEGKIVRVYIIAEAAKNLSLSDYSLLTGFPEPAEIAPLDIAAINSDGYIAQTYCAAMNKKGDDIRLSFYGCLNENDKVVIQGTYLMK